MRYGYARVSSVGQQRNGNSLDAQIELLKQRGAEVIVSECFTGRKVDRPKFTELLGKLQPGDELIVCRELNLWKLENTSTLKNRWEAVQCLIK